MKNQYETEIVDAVKQLAAAITPNTAVGNTDATGGYVTSLTEAFMGVTAGLVKIAEAVEHLAVALEERDTP